MKTKKLKRQQVPCTIRDKAELVLILCLIAGGFALILQFTSPSFFHSHFTNSTWWKTTASRWAKLHTSMFDQFTQEDVDESSDVLTFGDESVNLEEQNLYHVKSVVEKLKNEENYEKIVDSININDKKILESFMYEFKKEKEVEEMEKSRLTASDKQCDTIPENERFDCHPEKLCNEITCLERGCCWHKDERDGVGKSLNLKMSVPYCFYPRNYDSYQVEKVYSREIGNGTIEFLVDLTKKKSSYYPHDVMKLLMEVTFETNYRLRVKISDPNNTRWEVPTSGSKMAHKSGTDDHMYSFDTPAPGQPFFLTATRKNTNATILNTTGAFMFNDQFLQFSYFLPSMNIYGLGEHRDTLRHNFNWTKFVFWNKDSPPAENTNLYGSHPFYLMMEDDGNSHGVLLLNSNAMEAILQPAPAITWRTIGGVLDFYIFFGPTPSDVISQYTELIGRTFMPPYWSLGFHQCRWGYTTAEKTQAIADKLTKAGMPQDVQWNDIDYMDNKRDFTTSPGFGDQKGLVDNLHAQGKHYMMIVDPGISNTKKGSYPPYDLGMSLQIFINNTDGKPLVGKVWPGTTVFPDFTNPKSQSYWTTLVKSFHDSVSFDGMWIDMNEISNFVAGSTTGCSLTDRYEHPPYVPGVQGDSLRFNTVCASAKQYLSRTYNLHNLYGLGETNASYRALLSARPGKRPFIISRSTFPGQGQYGGHWTGDNAATYYDMYKSISDILSFNMFGIPMVGADICGFREATNEALCQRWYQLGAFYPFSRSHNSEHMPDQDPTAFSEALLNSTRSVYLTRYSLLPYLYTLFHKSHVSGDTVARPVFFEFPSDRATYNVDKQFLWGPALMISPVLDEDIEVEAYFPNTTWFYFKTGARMTDTGGTFRLPAPLNSINLNVRGGYILPMQEPALTTTHSRKNNFWLLVALMRSLEAVGELYWDDGDSVDSYTKGAYNMLQFSAQKKTLTSSLSHIGCTSEAMILGNITVLGVLSQPKSVTLNGDNTPFSYNQQHEVLYVTGIKVDMLKPISMTWS